MPLLRPALAALPGGKPPPAPARTHPRNPHPLYRSSSSHPPAGLPSYPGVDCPAARHQQRGSARRCRSAAKRPRPVPFSYPGVNQKLTPCARRVLFSYPRVDLTRLNPPPCIHRRARHHLILRARRLPVSATLYPISPAAPTPDSTMHSQHSAITAQCNHPSHPAPATLHPPPPRHPFLLPPVNRPAPAPCFLACDRPPAPTPTTARARHLTRRTPPTCQLPDKSKSWQVGKHTTSSSRAGQGRTEKHPTPPHPTQQHWNPPRNVHTSSHLPRSLLLPRGKPRNHLLHPASCARPLTSATTQQQGSATP